MIVACSKQQDLQASFSGISQIKPLELVRSNVFSIDFSRFQQRFGIDFSTVEAYTWLRSKFEPVLAFKLSPLIVILQ